MPYSASKICANCQHWNGPRQVSAFKTMSEVRSWGDKGLCTNRRSPNSNGRPRNANQPSNCNHFEKWDQLR